MTAGTERFLLPKKIILNYMSNSKLADLSPERAVEALLTTLRQNWPAAFAAVRPDFSGERETSWFITRGITHDNKGGRGIPRARLCFLTSDFSVLRMSKSKLTLLRFLKFKTSDRHKRRFIWYRRKPKQLGH